MSLTSCFSLLYEHGILDVTSASVLRETTRYFTNVHRDLLLCIIYSAASTLAKPFAPVLDYCLVLMANDDASRRLIVSYDMPAVARPSPLSNHPAFSRRDSWHLSECQEAIARELLKSGCVYPLFRSILPDLLTQTLQMSGESLKISDLTLISPV